MSIRSSNSPGVEIKERPSSLNITGFGNTVVLCMGFASKGETYTPQHIVSIDDFIAYFGKPETEIECYLYNTVKDIILERGTALVMRIPYDNIMDQNYKYYQNLSGSWVQNVESTTYDSIKISEAFQASMPEWTIFNEHKAKKTGASNDEGLFLSIVTVSAAIAAQGLTNYDENYIFDIVQSGDLSSSEFVKPLTGTIDDDSVSYDFAKLYPRLKAEEVNNLDEDIVTVVVAETKRNPNDQGKLDVNILEAHTGSINVNAEASSDIQNTKLNQRFFIGDVINRDSSYIKMYSTISNPSNLTTETFANTIPNGIYLLNFDANEYTKTIITSGLVQSIDTALNKVKYIEDYQIDIVVDAGLSTLAISDASNRTNYSEWSSIVSLYQYFCEYRGDCVTIVDGPKNLSVDNKEKIIRKTNDNTIGNTILPTLQYINTPQSTYLASYTNWIKSYNKFLGYNTWLPPSSKVAGVYIRHDKKGELGSGPAGLNYGVITNVSDLSFNPNQKEANIIYDYNLNYIHKGTKGETYVQGQKTNGGYSIFNRVANRRIMCRIKRYTHEVLSYYMYQTNNEFIRREVVNTIERLLNLLYEQGGLYDYKIVCDESNNTSEVIDHNELKLAIGLKFTKNVEFVLVDFIAETATNTISNPGLFGWRTPEIDVEIDVVIPSTPIPVEWILQLESQNVSRWRTKVYGNGIYIDGDNALQFTGDSSYLESLDGNLGAEFDRGDFTIEGYYYIDSNFKTSKVDPLTKRVNMSATLMSIGGGANSNTYALTYYIPTSGAFRNSTPHIYFGNGDYNRHDYLGTIELDTWTHVAICRQGTKLKCFMNGQRLPDSYYRFYEWGIVDYRNIYTTDKIYIDNIDTIMKMSRVRITKGISRYNGDSFTPPSRAQTIVPDRYDVLVWNFDGPLGSQNIIDDSKPAYLIPANIDFSQEESHVNFFKYEEIYNDRGYGTKADSRLYVLYGDYTEPNGTDPNFTGDIYWVTTGFSEFISGKGWKHSFTNPDLSQASKFGMRLGGYETMYQRSYYKPETPYYKDFTATIDFEVEALSGFIGKVEYRFLANYWEMSISVDAANIYWEYKTAYENSLYLDNVGSVDPLSWTTLSGSNPLNPGEEIGIESWQARRVGNQLEMLRNGNTIISQTYTKQTALDPKLLGALIALDNPLVASAGDHKPWSTTFKTFTYLDDQGQPMEIAGEEGLIQSLNDTGQYYAHFTSPASDFDKPRFDPYTNALQMKSAYMTNDYTYDNPFGLTQPYTIYYIAAMGTKGEISSSPRNILIDNEVYNSTYNDLGLQLDDKGILLENDSIILKENEVDRRYKKGIVAATFYGNKSTIYYDGVLRKKGALGDLNITNLRLLDPNVETEFYALYVTNKTYDDDLNTSYMQKWNIDATPLVFPNPPAPDIPAVSGNFIFSSDSSGNLYTVNHVDGSRTLIGNNSIDFRSLAFNENTSQLFGYTQSDYKIYGLNPTDGSATDIGFSYTHNTIASFANDVSGNMYFVESNHIHSIDISTQQTTFLSESYSDSPGSVLFFIADQAFHITGTNIYPINVSNGNRGPIVALSGDIGQGIRGVAYYNNKLYCINITGGGGTGKFAELDLSTGVVTNISTSDANWRGLISSESIPAVSPFPLPEGPPLPIAPSSVPTVSGSNIYLSNGTGGLYTVDPTTGVKTLIGNDTNNIGTLGYREASNQLFGYDSTADKIYGIDPANGEALDIGFGYSTSIASFGHDTSGNMYFMEYDDSINNIDMYTQQTSYICNGQSGTPGSTIFFIGDQSFHIVGTNLYPIHLPDGNLGSPIALSGDIGIGIRGVAYYDNKLYCLNNTNGYARFAELDVNTGIVTNIDTLQITSGIVYASTDSDSVSGPAYTWSDISSGALSGTLLSTVSTGDDAYELVALPFTFNFYGIDYNSVYVNSNGYLSFGSGNNDIITSLLPDNTVNVDLILGYGKDLNPGNQGNIYAKSEASKFTIQFENVRDYSNTGNITFQIVLNQSGVINLYYKELTIADTNYSVGVQNINGSAGTSISYNQAYLKNNFAIQLSGSIGYVDVQEEWIGIMSSVNTPTIAPFPLPPAPGPKPPITPVLGNVVFATDTTNLYSVNVIDGSRTLIGSTGQNIRSLAFRQENNLLYGYDPNDNYIFTIDGATGEASRYNNKSYNTIGDFVEDVSGNMFFSRSNDLYKTDITDNDASNTLVATVPNNGSGNSLVIIPDNDGQMFLTNGLYLYAINRITGDIETTIPITGATSNGIRGMAYFGGKVYCINITAGSGTGRFAEIDVNTGVLTNISTSDEIWRGLTSTEAITYLSAEIIEASGSFLYPTSGITSATIIDPAPISGTTSGLVYPIYDRVIPPMDSGTIYAIDYSSNLYTVNPNDGSRSLIGPTGVSRLMALSFKRSNQTLYAAEYHESGSPPTWIIDTNTGVATTNDFILHRLAHNFTENHLGETFTGRSQYIHQVDLEHKTWTSYDNEGNNGIVVSPYGQGFSAWRVASTDPIDTGITNTTIQRIELNTDRPYGSNGSANISLLDREYGPTEEIPVSGGGVLFRSPFYYNGDIYGINCTNTPNAFSPYYGVLAKITFNGGNPIVTNIGTTSQEWAGIVSTQIPYIIPPSSYSYIDSDDPSGPTYVWNDISSGVLSGTLLSTVSTSNDAYQSVALPFTFNFYGTDFNAVNVDSNGYLSFTSTYSDSFQDISYYSPGYKLPNPAIEHDMIAGYWTNLNPAASGSIYTKSESNKFTIQYENVRNYDNDDNVTFQIVLYETNEIEFYYKDVMPFNNYSIGVQNFDGTDGTSISYFSNYAKNNLAVRIYKNS